MNNLRYVRYSRKSSEAKERQAASIQDQNIECENYSIKKGLNIAYKIEESKSSFKPHIREEFNRMVDLIKNGSADAILTWKPDRLCRNPEEGGILLQMLQDGILKEIRTATGEVYTQDSDHLILQIHFGMANQYSRLLSQNVKRGLLHKVERGEYPGISFFGYKMVGEKGKKNLIPDPIEAPLVVEVYKRASTGQYSLKHLSNFLYSKGAVSKSSKPYCKQEIYRILTNPAYYGYFRHKGELYKGNYTPLITKTVFDAVQEALRDRSKPQVNIWTSRSYNGLVRCPRCGCSITTSFKKKYYKKTNRTAVYTYLHCTKRKGKCNELPVTIEDFERKVLDKVINIKIDEEVWKLGIELLKAKNKEEFSRNNVQIDKFNLDYKALQAKLNKLVDMRADNELTQEEFKIQKSLVLNEQARVNGLINDIKSSSRDWLELAEKFLNNAFYVRGVMEGKDVVKKRNLLTDVGENFYLDNKNPVFSFKKPYDILLKPEYRTSGRGRRDSNSQPLPCVFLRRLDYLIILKLGARYIVSTHFSD
jgi:site-specific DNA recombinase